MLVPAPEVPRFLGTVEPEIWLGHMDEHGFDWAVVVRRMLEADAGAMDALGMSMLAAGVNTEPVILTDETRPAAWDGNHRAAAALALSLPLNVITVNGDALLTASRHGYPGAT